MIQHAWTGYQKYAAPHDELKPVTVGSVDMLHGWGATLVESMDTLLLADMVEEYQAAKMMFLDRLKQHQWNRADDIGESDVDGDSKEQAAVENDSISFFNGVVRYIGGLLSAAELEEVPDPEVLQAAVSLGDRLIHAFQGSKNALPGNRIFDNGTVGLNEALFGKVSLAEVCTFQLEFRKLSQLSNDDKYMDLAQENFSYLSSLKPRIAGLYPAYFDTEAGASQDYVASFGSLSDGFYEYLLKTFILTGDVRFRDLYISTIEAMHSHLISRPHKKSEPYLVLGVYDTATESLVPKMDHLSCSAPGLLALGARVLGRTKDLVAARGLMETCYLSYKNSVTGLGADEIAFLESEYLKGRDFEMPQPSGFYVIDPEYNLQPETVESLFILYRITGDEKYQDYAWEIAQAIERNCRTKAGYSTLANVMDASEGMTDRMPSHFLAQTLKYLYLIFSSPDLASLDDFIFSTGGHLMKYPIA
ncbi:glycoside hydrolase [Dissophora ornata]|nr:glycoside hydrolase [Dissophora ornata]